MKGKILFVALFVLFVTVFGAVMVEAQGPKPGSRAPSAALGTAFTYQGQLKNSGTAVNGTCDFQFGLWDALSGGAQVGVTQTVSSVSVSGGLFTTTLNGGNEFTAGAFDGSARWLAIAVNCGSGLTALNPRQALTPAPYALYAASGPFWSLTGNSGTTPGTNFIGTSDNQSLVFKVNNARALLIEPNPTSPNMIGGFSGNTVSPGVVAATIGGGGQAGQLNRVTDNYGTVGGGINNQAGDNFGTTADKRWTTVGGGNGNIASGDLATVGGGFNNESSGQSATIPGGTSNVAQGDYSFAAGRNAQANHNGAFVWGDSTNAAVASTGDNQFVVRASGGVRLAGAGMNTSTSMFMHQVATGGGGNICAGQNYATVINNPLTNGDAGAILVVTPNYGATGAPYTGAGPAKDIPAVFYDSLNGCGFGAGKWVIYNLNTTAMVNQSVYNVLVIKP